MPILVHGRDIVNMVQGGTNNKRRIIGGSTGFTYGDTTSLSWEYPSPFGITIAGIDLSQHYKAKYVDYYNSSNGQTIPEGVKKIKVICIGGGGGGGSGNGGYQDWNTRKGRRRWHNHVDGTIGHAGMNGKYAVEEFEHKSRYFNVTIGEGGVGGAANAWSNAGNKNEECGASGRTGQETKFQIQGHTEINTGTAAGGSSCRPSLSGTPNPYKDANATTGKPNIYISGQILAGQGGRGGTGASGRAGGSPRYGRTHRAGAGGNGTKGFCRVYFLY